MTTLFARPEKWENAIKHTIKIVLSIVVIYVINLLLGMDSIISMQAMIAAIVIAAQANLAMSHHRTRLRIVGIVAGGLYGAVALALLTLWPSASLLIALLFIGIFAFSYIGLGRESIAYAGLQAGVILPLILLVGSGPVGSMTFGIDRFLGYFEGAAVALLIVHFIWPAHPLQIIKQRLQNAMKETGRFYQQIIAIDLPSKKLEARLTENINLFEESKFLLYGRTSVLEQTQSLINTLDDILVELSNIGELLVNSSTNKLAKRFLDETQDSLDIISLSFATTSHPELPTALSNIESKLSEYRQQKVTPSYSLDELENYATLALSLKQLCQSLLNFNNNKQTNAKPK